MPAIVRIAVKLFGLITRDGGPTRQQVAEVNTLADYVRQYKIFRDITAVHRFILL